jgi:uncharacterized protein (DUF1499 family)
LPNKQNYNDAILNSIPADIMKENSNFIQNARSSKMILFSIAAFFQVHISLIFFGFNLHVISFYCKAIFWKNGKTLSNQRNYNDAILNSIPGDILKKNSNFIQNAGSSKMILFSIEAFFRVHI